MRKILLLDNYDSFTYNLYHYVEAFNNIQVDVIRNDKVDIETIDQYDGIILSPGPGLPHESGLLIPVIKRYKKTKRILGVCLGQQAIAEVFDGELENLDTVYHGVSTPIKILEPRHYIFSGLPNKVEVGRYHSWVVSHTKFPNCLKVEALDNFGRIMALRHNELDICDVQFHPESILTPVGKAIIFNWLRSSV